MLKFALTGNIASGKSEVQYILEADGYKVLDTDLVCHELLEESVEIEEAFGAYDVFDNGKISRAKLGKLVFENSQLKKVLEDLLYPDLVAEIKAFFNANKDEKIVFVAAPQLFEAGMENLYDRVVMVYCPDEIRLERLIKRNNFTREYAQLRIASQMSQDEKVKKSDYIIRNDSDFEDLNIELERFYSNLCVFEGLGL